LEVSGQLRAPVTLPPGKIARWAGPRVDLDSQAIMLLICILEVSGSSLDLDTDYIDWGFSLVIQILPGECWENYLT
jgi:hypothetical protein